MSDFLPTASWENLRLRAGLLRRLREFFDSRHFLEVETPCLSQDIVIERHLNPWAACPADAWRQRDKAPRWWLQTSPEFALKRLLAAGATAIYQVTKCFRAGEVGRLHNPEFTMVEWYRPGDGLAEGMQLLDDLSQAMLGRGAAERLSYREAFERHLELDPHRAPPEELAAAAARHRLATPAGLDPTDRDLWLNLLLAERIEPQLGRPNPTILYDYPASQSALAHVREGDPPVAERFELYVDGIELANGYHELLDPGVLRVRNRTLNAARAADGLPTLPEDSRLLRAMEHGLPACAGVALGFDRLVMVATGASSIAEVIAFPAERA